MRKLSFRRPNVLFPKGRGWVVLTALVVLVLLALLRFTLPGAFAFVTSPFFRVGSAGSESVNSFFASFSNAQKLTLELENLRKENEELSITNDALLARIADIEKVMDFPTGDRTFILAGVLSGPPVSPYDSLLIEGGARHSVMQGARVYGPGGIPLGVIEDVHTGTSRVVLYSSPGRETLGWIGEDRTSVVFVGKGAGAFEMTLPKDVVVSVGDPLYLPGPGAMLMGYVGSISENPSSPDRRIRIRPAVNIFSLTWVVVESNPL